MKIENILRMCILFLTGFLVANIFNYYLVYGIENPFSGEYIISKNKDAPRDFISEQQIKVYHDRIVIYIENASIGRYASTGSMKPILDENSNGIRIVPKSEDEINVGDIITFKQNDYLIIHRVIEKGIDEQGIYFITKGDNNAVADEKIRFSEIKYVTVGLLW